MLGEELHVGPGREPGVEPCGFAQRRGAAAADPERRATRPLGLGLHRDVLEREVLAAEAHVVPPPQGLTDLERLQEPPDATLEGNARGGELLADRRIVGGDADPEDDATLGGAVEGADDVRQHDRVAQRRQEHARAQTYAPRAAGHRGQQRERLVSRPGDQRVPDPYGVEARGLRALGHGEQRRRLRTAGHDGLASRDQHAELDSHRYLPGWYFCPNASSHRR